MDFVFDTGASSVSISITEAFFLMKNGYLSEADIKEKEYYRIANGDIMEGTKINIKSIEIGGIELTNVEASVSHSMTAPLLLGQSALEKLGVIQFNPNQHTLTIITISSNSSSNLNNADIRYDSVSSSDMYNNNTYQPYAKNVVEIVKPDELYATYDIRSDALAMESMKRYGMNQSAIDTVIYNSHEQNWPIGINTFDKRYPNIARFNKYKSKILFSWADKSLLIIEAKENRKMPKYMRPERDIYFIYNSKSIRILD